MAYISPGAAFGSGLEEYTAQRDAQARQVMLDRITQDREQRLAEEAKQQAAMNQVALARQQKMDERGDWEFQQKQDEAARNTFARKTAALMPGDVPDAATMAEAQRLGVPLAVSQKPVAETPQGSDTVTLPGLDGKPSEATMTGSALPSEKLSIPVYQGDAKFRAQRAAEMADLQQRQPIIEALQAGQDPAAIMLAAMQSGMDPAKAKAIIESTRPDTQGVWQVGRDGKLTQMGTVPKGDQLRMEPAPVTVRVGGPGAGAGGGFDQDMIDMDARAVAQGAPMPTFAGVSGNAIKEAIRKRAAHYNTDTGEFMPDGVRNPHPPDLRNAAIGFNSDKSASTQLAKTFVMTEAFTDAARLNMEKMNAVLDRVPDSNLSPVNAVTRGFMRNTGDTDIAQFDTYRKSVATEFARIITQINGGVLTDSARKEIDELVRPNASVAQIRASVDALSQEAASRSSSYQQWQDRISGGLGNVSTSGERGPSGSKFKIISVEPIGK